MIFLFLFHQCVSLGSEVRISASACTCVNTSGFCDADCRKIIKKKDFLQKCPDKPFQQDLSLSSWLLAEFFCIKWDHRHLSDESYNPFELENITIDNDGKDDDSDDDSGVYNYSKPLLTSEGNYYLPTPFLASAECHYDIRPLEFLVPIDSIRCYYRSSNISEVHDLIKQDIENVKTVGREECLKDKIKSIDYLVKYDADQMIPTELQLRCSIHDEEKYDDENIMIPLQIGVHFYNQAQNESIINKTMKSGEAGYSHGKPLIARRAGSSRAEPFPIPHGYDCSDNSSMAFTPLIFGYDTLSGCTEGGTDKTDITDILKTYTSISKMGKAHGNYNQDWIDISNIDAIDNCSNLILTINYEYVGNLHNPQNKIYAASYRCDSKEEEDRFIFLVNYLRTSDEKVKPYIPKPKGLPDDTFAPIR